MQTHVVRCHISSTVLTERLAAEHRLLLHVQGTQCDCGEVPEALITLKKAMANNMIADQAVDLLQHMLRLLLLNKPCHMICWMDLNDALTGLGFHLLAAVLGLLLLCQAH